MAAIPLVSKMGKSAGEVRVAIATDHINQMLVGVIPAQ